MGFINELTSKDDRERYGLDDIDGSFIVDGVKSRYWTIDRDRDVYLRQVRQGREDRSHISEWTFYWSGYLVLFEIEALEAKNLEDEHRWAHMKVTRLNLPNEIKKNRTELIKDIHLALESYKGSGVFAKCKTYELKLDVIDEA